MAINKTLNIAVPYSKDGKVTRWELGMKYAQGTEGEDDYYTSNTNTVIESSIETPAGTVNNFTPKAEADWSKSDLEALCPTTKWDAIFASQYDSVITNPPKVPVVNNEFSIPS